LRTDADGAARFVAEEHALDLAAVGKRKQQLLGAVVGLGVTGDGRCPDREVGGKLSAQGQRQVRHPGERIAPPIEEPLANLADPVGALPAGFQPGS
jgi:hypothetical protein